MMVRTLSLVQKGQTSGCCGIVVYGGGDIIHWVTASTGLTFFAPKNNVPTTIYHYSTVSTAYYVHWFDLFVSRNNVPTAIYHYSTVYCVLHPLV